MCQNKWRARKYIRAIQPHQALPICQLLWRIESERGLFLSTELKANCGTCRLGLNLFLQHWELQPCTCQLTSALFSQSIRIRKIMYNTTLWLLHKQEVWRRPGLNPQPLVYEASSLSTTPQKLLTQALESLLLWSIWKF